MAALGHRLGVEFASHRKKAGETQFASADGTRLLAVPSKQYQHEAYWFGVGENQRRFLEESEDAHVVLGCEGLPHAYAFGYQPFKAWARTGKHRWQIHIKRKNSRRIMNFGPNSPSGDIPLEDYELPLGNGAPLADAPRGAPLERVAGASRLGVAEQTAAPPSSRLGAAEPPSSLSAATPRGRPGPVPTDAIARSVVVRDMRGPCFTYAMQFGARQVWKIGISKNILQRRKDANWFVPHEVLNEQWRVARQIQHATGKEAYKMEQAILNQAKTKNLKQKNERIQCTEAQLDRLWEEALSLSLREKKL